MSNGNKDISVRISVTDGKKATAELVGFGKQGAAAIREVDNAGMNAQGIQNLSYQMNDLFVQVNGGTDVMRALGQQLPQMLQGFGVFGAVAGVAAAALVPLIGNLFGAEEEAEKLEDAVAKLSTSHRDYMDAIEKSLQPLGKLKQEFGDNAEEAQRLQQILLSVARADYSRAVGDAGRSVRENLEGLSDIVREIQSNREYMGTAVEADALAIIKDQQEELREEFGLTEVQAVKVQEALDAWSKAKGPSAMSDAANQLVEALSQSGSVTGEMSEGVSEALKLLIDMVKQGYTLEQALDAARDQATSLAGIDMSSGISAAGAVATGLANELERALRNAQSIASAGIASLEESQIRLKFKDQPVQLAEALAGAKFDASLGQLPTPAAGSASAVAAALIRDTRRSVIDAARQTEMNRLELAAWQETQRGGRKGGGGGASKARTDAEREAERVYAATRTEAEKYALELDKLNKLQADGQISADTYARAVAQAQEALAKSDETAKFWRDEMDDLNKGILDAITNGGSLSDVLGDVGKALERAAWEAALFGTGPMATGGGFSLLGGLGDWVSGLMSFDGGGHTGNGARSGGLDGRGGFLAIMHPRERVEDLTRPQGGGGAGALQISLGPGLQAEWLGKSGQQARIISQEASARQARALPAAMRHMQARGTAS